MPKVMEAARNADAVAQAPILRGNDVVRGRDNPLVQIAEGHQPGIQRIRNGQDARACPRLCALDNLTGACLIAHGGLFNMQRLRGGIDIIPAQGQNL